MEQREISQKFLLGGSVTYQGKLHAVIAMNNLNHTVTLERLSDQQVVTDVKMEKLS